jgi:hypothetical protein
MKFKNDFSRLDALETPRGDWADVLDRAAAEGVGFSDSPLARERRLLAMSLAAIVALVAIWVGYRALPRGHEGPATSTPAVESYDGGGWMVEVPSTWATAQVGSATFLSSRALTDAEIDSIRNDPASVPQDMGVVTIADVAQSNATIMDVDSKLPLSVAFPPQGSPFTWSMPVQGNGTVRELSVLIGSAASSEIRSEAQQIVGSFGFPHAKPLQPLDGWLSVGTAAEYSSQGLQLWVGDRTSLAIAHGANGYYAIDLSDPPTCPSQTVEGSGVRIDDSSQDIVFDCADQSELARYDREGVPASSNPTSAGSPLPLRRVILSWDGKLLVSDRWSPNRPADSFWKL